MSFLTSADAPPTSRARTTAPDGRTQGLLAVGVLVGVVAVDQATKWWAWRHVFAVINSGGTWFLGSRVGGWYSGEVAGAVLDVLGAQALSLALFALLRRRRSPQLLLPALLAIGGWGSNLLDRLGLHLLTAPGMGRGAVDFIPAGGLHFNVGDVFIVVGTVLFGLALHRARRRTAGAAAGRRSPGASGGPRPWRRAGRWALLAAVAPAVLGAAVTLTATGGSVAAAASPVLDLFAGG